MQHHNENTTVPSAPDALILLVQRISDAQVQQGHIQAKQTEDQHAIRLTLALLTARLEPLASLIPDLTSLRLANQQSDLLLDQHATAIQALRTDVDVLKTANAARNGWEGFGGKLLYLVGGTMVTALIGVAVMGIRA